MTTTAEHDRRIAQMTISTVFPLYVNQVERKGRTKEELLQVIEWLTAFDEPKLKRLI